MLRVALCEECGHESVGTPKPATR